MSGAGYTRSYPAVPYTTLNGGDMGASITGPTIDVSDTAGYIGFQITYTNTNTPVGTFDLQYSMDGTTWVTITSTAVDSTLSAAIDVLGTNFQYVRVNYTRASGGSTATVSASYRKTLKV